MKGKNIFILATDTCYGIACAIDDIKAYERIYKIKKRSFDKALAVMVSDFDWLQYNTYLSEEQIDFLKTYDTPFTILCECPAIRSLIHFDDDNAHFFKNKDVYEKIAIRIAHTPSQKKLINKVGPIFLTSANISGQNEIFDYKEIKEAFSEYENIVHMVDTYDIVGNQKSSDIFQFIGESTDLDYLRKNS